MIINDSSLRLVATPDGYPAVLSTFGNIHRFIRDDGTLDPRWEEQRIVRIELPKPMRYQMGTDPDGSPNYIAVKRITAHKLVAPLMTAVLRDIHRARLWSEIDPYGGGFAFRPIRGRPERLSLHSFGIAWDFRPAENPLGKVGTMSPAVVEIFESNGFVWGGRFRSRSDPMHFQYARNA